MFVPKTATLIVYGGKALQPHPRVLSDVYALDMTKKVPSWTLRTPRPGTAVQQGSSVELLSVCAITYVTD